MSKSLNKIQWGWVCIEALNKLKKINIENRAKIVTPEKWLIVTPN
jgi:hypothetical protein